jgi:cellulose synthase/poly-beta-1,6-N-acetylglucosamine synthase-like glycosyltransferase
MVIALVIAVFTHASFGGVLIQDVGFVSLSLYGVVATLRKILQLLFARVHNRSRSYLVRKPLIDELIDVAPYLSVPAQKLLARPLHFDEFKTEVLQLLGDFFDQNELALTEQLEEQIRFDLSPSYVRSQWIDVTWRQLMANSFRRYGEIPLVGIVIPTYRTSKLELQRLIDSIEDQTYPHIYVCIVLNENDPELKAFVSRLIVKYGGARYIWFVEPRKGKRNAMYKGFVDFLQDSRVKYVFNVDSDTLLHIDAIANAVRVFQSDEQIGCMTGDIRVANPHVNLLTRLTYQRYYFAFNVERAAQSFWNSVTCMSGPLMGIRSTILHEILGNWANQMFLGKLCNYGDDRHIATLVLKQGLKSVFSADSIAWTDVPDKIAVWKRQQTRWARSAWRETIITLPWMHRLPLWVIFDIAYQALFPFILWGIMLLLLYKSMVYGPQVLIPYALVTTALVFLANSVYGILVNRDFNYVLCPLYLVYQFIYLHPLRLWALISLDKTEWGTK